MNIYSEDNYIVIENVFYDGRKDGRLLVPYNALALDVLDDEILIKSAENGDVLCAVNAENLYLDGVLADMSTLYEDFDSIAYRASGGPAPEPEEMDWFTITNLTATDSSVLIAKEGNVNNISLKVSNDGENWTEYNDISTNLTLALPANGYLKFNGRSNDHWSTNDNNYWKFHLNTRVKVSGNLNTLLADSFTAAGVFSNLFFNESNLINASELVLLWTSLAERCYYNMFSGCSSLTTAPELPATTLASNCYAHMFEYCSSLTTAPDLPATTLANSCYSFMFYDCTNLTTAPTLPATSLYGGNNCYQDMFYGCSSLTTAPTLPATTLAGNCYQAMFEKCTSLTTAPALPATTLAGNCYQAMFEKCTSLTTAPALPATTLDLGCYSEMFSGCTSLVNVPELPATTLARNCYKSMFSGCSALTSAPALPATTLAEDCYDSMFRGCTSLTTAPTLPATSLQQYCYDSMFNGCTSLTSAPALPATTLQSYCYYSMFSGCTSLTTAPALPATTLANNCYQYMFRGCSSLTTAPALPATTLSDGCYNSMFNGCTSLTTAPDLPATNFYYFYSCYASMFQGCSSLTTAPALPATTLQPFCYYSMFSGCTSLTSAPALPATTLQSSCYQNMFSGCSSLNYINCLATDISATNACAGWTQNVSPTGTFECAAGMSATWPTGISGIPTGWTVVDPSVSQTVSFTIQGYDDVGCLPNGIEGVTLTKTVNGVSEDFSFPATGTLDFTVANDASTTPITFTQDKGTCCAQYVTITPSDIVENYSGVYSMSEGTTDEECECINPGGTWDPVTQTCTPPEPPEPPTVDCATEWQDQGYSSYEDCQCSNYGTDCPNYFTIINNTSNEGNISIEETTADGGSALEISLEYSNDGGTSWTPITVNLQTAPVNITLPADGAVLFRGSNPDFGSRIARQNAGAQPWQDGWSIRSTTPHAVQGDLGTLIDATNHSASGLFTAMFMNDTGLVDATSLVIPTYTVEATVQGQQYTWTDAAPAWCCQDLFRGCTSLVNAPVQLNATALMSGCYTRMFFGCTSLQHGGIVTSNNLLNIDYASMNNAFVCNLMFYGCTNLQTLSFLGFPAAYSSGAFRLSKQLCNMWLENAGAGTLTGIANLNNGTWWNANTSGLPSNWTYSGTATMPTA